MSEHDHEPGCACCQSATTHSGPQVARTASTSATATGTTPHGALALQRTIGNRATTQMIARMEASEASEQIVTSLAPLTDEATIGRTLAPYAYDAEGFDKVAEAYEKKVEKPMMSDLPASAQDAPPAGWYPGISKG